MATYDNDLRLKEITTGDESGTWGTSTNANLELIAEAFSYGTEASFSSDADATTTIADGLTDPARSLYFKVTSGVSLTATRTLTIAPNDVSKIWIIENATSGSQSINISQGSGANITIPAGDTKVVYSDGAGAGAAFFDAFASLSVVDLKVQDDLTVTDDASIGGDATITGTLGVTGVFTGTSLDISGDIDVDGTTNLDVVDIDGAVDMATTLAVAGNVDFNGDLDVDGTTNLDVVDIDGAVDMASTLTVAGDANFDSGTLFVDVSTNRVGIGTSAPVQVLHLGGASNKAIQITSSTSNAGYFGVYQDQAGFTVNRDASDGTFADAGKTEAAIVLQSQNADSFITFRTTGTNNAEAPERMRINKEGSVGIGTNSPSAKLHVATSGAEGINIGLQNSERYWNLETDGGLLMVKDVTAGSLTRIAFDTSGFILAGTTSSAAGNKAGQIVAASGIITTEASITTTNGTVDVTVPPGGIMITSQSGYSEDAAIFTYKADGGSQGVFGTGIGNSNWAFGTTSEPAGAQRNKVWVQTTNTLRFKDNGYGARTYQLTILSNSA
jgi:hypothetical protein